jgi:acetyl-CoA carboxylase alpha subunit
LERIADRANLLRRFLIGADDKAGRYVGTGAEQQGSAGKARKNLTNIHRVAPL